MFLSVMFKQRVVQQDILYYCNYILLSSNGVGWSWEATCISKEMSIHR